MDTKKLLTILGKKFPKKYAELYHDYIGLMVGKLPNEVHRILLALDYDETILEDTIAFKPDLILTHHPFIYGKKKEVLEADPKKAKLYKYLEEHNLPIYSMHTNFDTGKDGMNDALADALCLHNIYAPTSDITMRIGELDKEMDIFEFARYAKEKLHVNYGLLLKNNDKPIKKVGIVGGGGYGEWEIAMKEGCDIYISGDCSHHIRRGIIRYQYNYLDLPHEIEKIFVYQMEKILHHIDPSLEIKIIDHEKEPLVI